MEIQDARKISHNESSTSVLSGMPRAVIDTLSDRTDPGHHLAGPFMPQTLTFNLSVLVSQLDHLRNTGRLGRHRILHGLALLPRASFAAGTAAPSRRH
jgi:hypothetical protein